MSGLQFPQDITQSGRYMTMRFSAYQRRTLNAPAVTSPLTGANTIRLPLPNDLVDSQRVQYNDNALSPAVGAILENVIGNNIRRPNLGSISELSNFFSTSTLESAVGPGVAGATGLIANQLTGALGGAPYRAVSQFAGIAVNPFLSVSFETPQFKTHRFSWKLVPRDQVESNTIKNIITAIKKAMLPGVRNLGGVIQNNLLFDYPDIVEIFLNPNEYTYNFKHCVVKSFNVNYAPGNSPAFYRGSNAPVAVDITIELQEIEYWTKADIDPNAAQSQFTSLSTLSAAVTSAAAAIAAAAGRPQTPPTPPATPNPTTGTRSGPN